MHIEEPTSSVFYDIQHSSRSPITPRIHKYTQRTHSGTSPQTIGSVGRRQRRPGRQGQLRLISQRVCTRSLVWTTTARSASSRFRCPSTLSNVGRRGNQEEEHISNDGFLQNRLRFGFTALVIYRRRPMRTATTRQFRPRHR